jgi:hypothetical protein
MLGYIFHLLLFVHMRPVNLRAVTAVAFCHKEFESPCLHENQRTFVTSHHNFLHNSESVFWVYELWLKKQLSIEHDGLQVH